MSDESSFHAVLATVSSEVRRYGGEISDYVDGHFDHAADLLRERLATATWVPEAVRARLPQPRPPPDDRLAQAAADLPLYERVQDWVLRHKILTTFLALVASTVAYRGIRRAQSLRKLRRARRARNGARCEVVIIAASPSLPVTQSLALDLERRGYIVYIVSDSAEEEHAVKQMSRPDIRPLSIDITDGPTSSASLDKFAQYLHAPHAAVPGARRSHLTLTGLILIPSLSYQTSPIATIPPANFADLFNTHLLHPILTVQAFLPLLTARTALQPGEKPASLLSAASSLSLARISGGGGSGGSGADGAAAADTPAAAAAAADKPPTPNPPKVLVFTPSIISSVNPPFHAPESTVCSALSAFTEVLAAELRPLAIPVTHIQLGTFDFSGFAPARSVTAQHFASQGRMAPPAVETLAWTEPARHVYGRNFTAQSTSALGSGRAIRGLRGTAMRDLHHAVFDVLDGSSSQAVVRVGLGADLYGFVGSFVPRGLVAWMMGVRKVDDLGALYAPPAVAAAANSSVVSAVSAVSDASSTATATASPSGRRSKKSGNGFIAVPDAAVDSHIWR